MNQTAKDAEQEQYDRVCEPKFDDIIGKLDDITSRLFEDNGNKSIQSRINDNAIWCHVVKWVTITITSTFIACFIGLLFWIIKSKIN